MMNVGYLLLEIEPLNVQIILIYHHTHLCLTLYHELILGWFVCASTELKVKQ